MRRDSSGQKDKGCEVRLFIVARTLKAVWDPLTTLCYFNVAWVSIPEDPVDTVMGSLVL